MIAEIRKSSSRIKRKYIVEVQFSIPDSLGQILLNGELSKDQKINLVKSYTDNLKDEKGKELESIPNQQAVCLIMALEIDAL